MHKQEYKDEKVCNIQQMQWQMKQAAVCLHLKTITLQLVMLRFLAHKHAETYGLLVKEIKNIGLVHFQFQRCEITHL